MQRGAVSDHQIGIEKLGRASNVLALSGFASSELPANLGPEVTVTVSGARPGLGPCSGRPTTAVEPRHCVLLGNALFKQQKYTEAIREYKTVLRAQPGNTEARRSLEAAERRQAGR